MKQRFEKRSKEKGEQSALNSTHVALASITGGPYKILFFLSFISRKRPYYASDN